jgi:hypothetical protein
MDGIRKGIDDSSAQKGSQRQLAVPDGSDALSAARSLATVSPTPMVECLL